MKKCFKCGRYKPLHLFYAHKEMADGHLGKCKACTKKDVQERYHNPEYRERIAAYERKRWHDKRRKANVAKYQKKRRRKFPGKERARSAVGNAVRDGRLTMKDCEKCGFPKSQAHHTDYRKKFDVTWLCFKCHREEHGQTVNS